MTTSPTLRRAAAGLLALAVLGGLAGCGDDDGTAAAADVPSDEVAPEACDAAVEMATAFGQAPEDPAEFAGYAAEAMVPPAQALAETLPEHEGAATLLATYEQLAEDGDPSAFESPEFTGAQAEVGATIHEGCDLEAVDVTAQDYEYTGVPAELDAGRVSFAMTNEGTEEHEMVLFRRNDGVTDDIMTLLESGDAMMEKVSFTGVAFGPPESTTYAAFDLEPGTYFLVCFIPTGGDESAPPHFVHGMHDEITVS